MITLLVRALVSISRIAACRKCKIASRASSVAGKVAETFSFIREGQESGRIIDAKPEVIAGIVRAVVTLTTHKDDIGREIYPEVLEMMIDFVARGLTDGRA